MAGQSLVPTECMDERPERFKLLTLNFVLKNVTLHHEMSRNVPSLLLQ